MRLLRRFVSSTLREIFRGIHIAGTTGPWMTESYSDSERIGEQTSQIYIPQPNQCEPGPLEEAMRRRCSFCLAKACKSRVQS
jgi:hypothetical protein